MSFSRDGYEIVNDFIEPVYLDAIKAETEMFDFEVNKAGIRNAEVRLESVRALLNTGALSKHAESYLGKQSNFVRAILFDKTPKNNWLVTWHQDKTIMVSSKQDIEGWGAWSIKNGCHHVQPGLEVLNSMVAFRLHIDASTEESGCLRVIPESHAQGVMLQTEIDDYVRQSVSIQCIAKAYSALIMRPHLLHASSKAARPSHRRVLHVEYSSYVLPEGLAWV